MVEFCDRIGIMYAGNWWKWRRPKAIPDRTAAPPTPGALAIPSRPCGPKTVLEGYRRNPLNLLEVPVGCRFQARCSQGARALPPEYTRLAGSCPANRLPATFMRAAEEQPDLPIHLDKAAGCWDVCHANRPNRRATSSRSQHLYKDFAVSSTPSKGGKMRALSRITFNLHRGRAPWRW